MTKSNFLLFGLLIFTYIFIFKAFFLPGPLVFGDAPYFYLENLSELFRKPLAWDFRNSNFGAGQELVLWLYLPTFLMGLIHNFTGLGAESLIRIIFYLPSTVLAILGAYYFARSYTKEKLAPILAATLYGFNTYFLLLLDGGQIGVALAYGIFPWVIIYFKKLFTETNLKNFLIATLLFTITTNIDLRIAVLSISAFLLISIFEIFSKQIRVNFQKILKLSGLFLVTALLASFWLIPFIKASSKQSYMIQEVSNLNLVSMLDAILYFSPHFPENEFGEVVPPPFYYIFLPFLIFGGFFLKPARKLLPLGSSLVILIFLTKGSSEPFGQIYNFLVSLPLGVSLRDSSKFFIPSLLFASALLVISFEVLISNKGKLKNWIFILVYIYLIFLVWPAIFGQMSGVLAGKQFDKDYQVVYDYLKNDQHFFRSVWFPQRPPLAFSSAGKEAVSANELYKDKPFASMISGNYDLFYFLHDEQLSDWFKLLGIKYAFFPEDERKKTWSEVEKQNRQIFLQFVDQRPNFKKLNLGTTFPGYIVSDPNPKIFGQNKVLLVLGDSSIYPYLKNKIQNFSLSNQGFIFLEDGIFNPQDLLTIHKDSAVLVVKDRDKNDLAMSLLQNKFIETLEKSEWGKYSGDQYLSLKYKLLQEGIESLDLGFGKGIYFSTQKNEKIIFKKEIKNSGKYRLAFRSISSSDSGKLKFTIEDIEGMVKYEDRFRWHITNPVNLKKGPHLTLFENLGGFQAINIVAVIPEDDYQSTIKKANDLVQKSDTFILGNSKDEERLFDILSKLKSYKINYKQIDPTRYEITFLEDNPRWLVFSDHFSKNWIVDGSQNKAVPIYSMINGFYIDRGSKNVILRYKGQEQVEKGVAISLISLSMFIVAVLVVILKKLR